MLKLYIKGSEFEYDINALVREFFPGEEIKLYEDRLGLEELSFEKEEETDNIILVQGDLNFNYKIRVKERSIETGALSKEHSLRKSQVKMYLYKLLKEETGLSMPWGTLTGIRPSKIPMKAMEEGHSKEEILKLLESEYLVSEDKAKLSIEVAEKEKKLLDKIKCKNSYSLYIGIPFCPTTCLYCSFTSFPISAWKNKVDDYLDVLIKELLFVADKFKGQRLDTIYMGGGTPSTLSPKQFVRVLNCILENFDLSNLSETTIECGRPDSITKEKLEAIKRFEFVDRISVNPQTMNQETLDLIGRRHSVRDVKEKFYLARELGFDNINMDLIAGLPGENATHMERTMEEIRALKPDNVTVHSLAVKRAARLNLQMDKYKDTLSLDIRAELNIADKFSRKMGLEPYYMYRQKNMAGNFENVGYSIPGKEGLYNILIMEEVQSIVACGAGTVSKRVYPDGRIERCDNVKDVGLYIEKIDYMIDRKNELYKEYI